MASRPSHRRRKDSPATPAIRVALRLKSLPWTRLEEALNGQGWARTTAVLSPQECRGLAALYAQDDLYRKRINMERYRYGEGDYSYFAYPLPALVAQLRTHAYRHLAPIANRWSEALGRGTPYPRSLRGWLAQCHQAGQRRPTPLLLQYSEGGYNCLHQDRYGELSFPLQVAILLSRPGRDFGGGEFLLVENRPRSQSIGHAITLQQGQMVIFPSLERPAEGKRGTFRVQLRHGVSRITRGRRHTLGLIFHDAE